MSYLYKLIQAGDASALDKELNTWASAMTQPSPDIFNPQDENGFTPLTLAADLNRLDMVQILLKYRSSGLNVNQSDGRNRTALRVAATKNYAQIVTALLDAGADPSLKDQNGKDALHLTVNSMGKIHESVLTVLALLPHLAADDSTLKNLHLILHLMTHTRDYNANSSDINKIKVKVTEIQFSVHDDDVWDTYKALADTSLVSHHVMLFSLASWPKWQHSLQVYLPQWGAVKGKYVDDLKTAAGATAAADAKTHSPVDNKAAALSIAAAMAIATHVIADPKSDAKDKSISEKKFDINFQDQKGDTALHSAVAGAAATLIDYGANVNARNKAQQTPLMTAASEANIPVVKTLLEQGSDVKAVDIRGNTALDLVLKLDERYQAVAMLDTVKLLVMYGVVVTEKTLKKSRGQAIRKILMTGLLMTAMKTPEAAPDGITPFLKKPAPARHTAFEALLKQDDLKFLEYELEPDFTNADGETILSIAASDEFFTRALRPLFLTDLPQNSSNQTRVNYCLELAVCKGYLNSITALVKLGGNMHHVIDEDGNSILMAAAGFRNGSLQALIPLPLSLSARAAASDQEVDAKTDAKVVSAHQSNLEARNRRQQTALLLAADSRMPKNVSHLLALGAKVNVADNTDHTPIYTAVLRSDVDSIEAICNYPHDPKTLMTRPQGETLSLMQQARKIRDAQQREAVMKQLLAVGALPTEELLQTPLLSMISKGANQAGSKEIKKLLGRIFTVAAYGVLFKSKDKDTLPIQHLLDMKLAFEPGIREELLADLLSAAPHTQLARLDSATKTAAAKHMTIANVLQKYEKHFDIIDFALYLNQRCGGKQDDDLKMRAQPFVNLAQFATRVDSKIATDPATAAQLTKILTDGVQATKRKWDSPGSWVGSHECAEILSGLQATLSGKRSVEKFKEQWNEFNKFRTSYPEHFTQLTIYLTHHHSSVVALMQSVGALLLSHPATVEEIDAADAKRELGATAAALH